MTEHDNKLPRPTLELTYDRDGRNTLIVGTSFEHILTQLSRRVEAPKKELMELRRWKGDHFERLDIPELPPVSKPDTSIQKNKKHWAQKQAQAEDIGRSNAKCAVDQQVSMGGLTPSINAYARNVQDSCWEQFKEADYGHPNPRGPLGNIALMDMALHAFRATLIELVPELAPTRLELTTLIRQAVQDSLTAPGEWFKEGEDDAPNRKHAKDHWIAVKAQLLKRGLSSEMIDHEPFDLFINELELQTELRFSVYLEQVVP